MITCTWLVGVALIAQVPPPTAASADSAGLRRQREEIREREAAALGAIADRIKASGRKSEAEAVLAHVEPSPPAAGPFRFVPLPDVVPSRAKTNAKGLANVPAGRPTSTASTEREPEIDAVRAGSARALFDLAVRSLSGTVKHYALADECLRAVLSREPDHAEARRLLGYVPHDDGWATPYAIQSLKLGKVQHPTYGWVDASWVPHLERGELPGLAAPGQKQAPWLPAADADALRDTIARPWRINTEHFQILADVPLSEAIAFGRKLEDFHELFFSLFSDVIADDLPLARRFRDKSRPSSAQYSQHTVYYFANKQEYVEFLRPRETADIAETLGIYLPPAAAKKRGAAYFFRDPGGQLDVSATLFHEVSHQLLFESTRVGPNVYKGNPGNYWVFEGLGTYFETVAVAPDGTLQVGGYIGPRIEVARIFLLDRGEHVPVEQLVRLSQARFNTRESIHLHYAEAMALTVFLLEGRDGRYREGFLDYVRDALRGRLRADGRTLDDRLGVSYQALDAEFLADIKPRP